MRDYAIRRTSKRLEYLGSVRYGKLLLCTGFNTERVVRHTAARGLFAACLGQRGLWCEKRAIRQPWSDEGATSLSRGWADQLQGLPGGVPHHTHFPCRGQAAASKRCNDDRDRKEVALGNVLTGPQLHGPSRPLPDLRN
jgi:hypothetical protein